MRYLHHESGEAATLKNGQVLGDDSPLEFDEDGRAGPLEDALAEKVAAMDKRVHLGRRARPDDDAAGDESGDEFDAVAFVDRTPMADVVDDIETGDYDAHLDAIEAEADREGVKNALDARRE